MEAKIKWHEDMWQEIKNNALFTIGKSTTKYPTSEWKRKILLAEHSPIRTGHIVIEITDCPSFVLGHLVRHTQGVTPYIQSLRSDRADYEETPNRNTLQGGRFDFNFQALINISRKRLCSCASLETRQAWQKVKDEVAKVEPELASCMVRECVYRNGMCPEYISCGYNRTITFEKELKKYRGE